MVQYGLVEVARRGAWADKRPVTPGVGERRMARLICIGMAILTLLLLPGCRGCRQGPPPKDKTAEEVEKEREELRKRELELAKPNFEAKYIVSRPSYSPPSSGLSVGACGYKPGHWTCVALEDAKANHFDFVGELELAPPTTRAIRCRLGPRPSS